MLFDILPSFQDLFAIIFILGIGLLIFTVLDFNKIKNRDKNELWRLTCLSILLFITIWIFFIDEFQPSLEKAVEKQRWNHAFLTVELEKDSALLFMEEEKGLIRIASAYRQNMLGWRIADNIAFLFRNELNDDVEGFNGVEGSMIIKNNRKVNYLVGIIVDENIDRMTYTTDKETKEQIMNTFTTPKGTRIYYSTDEEAFGTVTYRAYNHQNGVIYSKP